MVFKISDSDVKKCKFWCCFICLFMVGGIVILSVGIWLLTDRCNSTDGYTWKKCNTTSFRLQPVESGTDGYIAFSLDNTIYPEELMFSCQDPDTYGSCISSNKAIFDSGIPWPCAVKGGDRPIPNIPKHKEECKAGRILTIIGGIVLGLFILGICGSCVSGGSS